ncbi:hypothetical protein G9A89_003927 [Geosiphon pyriformis]|nr:hypothetical protein G9A89_003927 [Geosiphon pyriformis]
MTKYIFFTYGIIAGYKKGILAASTGLLLKSLGLEVTAARIDPFIQIDGKNLDPGNIFLLNDGGVVAEELGNYERFLQKELTKKHYITSGQVFDDLVKKERAGGFLGRSVTLVGHGTDRMQELIQNAATGADVCILELGAEIDLPDAQTWLEAIDELQAKVGAENVAFVHVVPLLALPNTTVATITKPAFDSHRSLITNGTTPDLIACLCSGDLDNEVCEKICFEPTNVIPINSVPTSYHQPLALENANFLDFLSNRLQLDLIEVSQTRVAQGKELLRSWRKLVADYDNCTKTVTIALVGRYNNQQDLYNSIVQALEHASIACGRRLILNCVEVSYLESESKIKKPHKHHEAWENLLSANGIIVPDGFSHLEIEGILTAINFARNQRKPFLGTKVFVQILFLDSETYFLTFRFTGIGLGFQTAIIEFSRNVCGINGTYGFSLPRRLNYEHHGNFVNHDQGIGVQEIIFQNGSESWSKIRRLYESVNWKRGKSEVIKERHHSHYKINDNHLAQLEKKGLTFIARDPVGNNMEIFEMQDLPFFVGVQYHPEYLSRPLQPAPEFLGLVLASTGLSMEWYLEKAKRLSIDTNGD